MKRTKRIVTNALNSVDIFEEPIHFNMSGDTNLTSSLGGVLSIAIIIFLGVQAITQSIDMFNRAEPQLLQMNEYEDEPTSLYVNQSNNFVMAVSMNRDNSPMDLTQNAVMSFVSSYNQYIRASDGTQKKLKAFIYWAPCTKDNFPSPTFPDNTFSIYSLNYAYCPTVVDFTDPTTHTCADEIKQSYPNCKTPPQFRIQGTFLSIEFEFINFKLRTCTNADAPYIAGLHCTTENINTAFTNSEFQMNLYFSNSLIDPVNFGTPNRTFLDTIYWNLHPSVSTAADLFVDTETVQDFNDYFSTEEHENRTYYSVSKASTREVRKFKSSSLLEWNLRRSNLNHITSRTYTKVLDVVSNVGGMSELFMLLGAFIALGYTRFKYIMILGNELYDFQPTNHKKQKPDNMDTSKSGLMGLTTRLGDISVVSVSVDGTADNKRNQPVFRVVNPRKKTQIETLDKNADKNTVKEYFELLKKRKRVLGYGETSYVKTLFKYVFRIKSDPDELMALKARKQVRDDLDIIKVIEKLKEVDKLKMLLLNSEQRKAFDFIERPLFVEDRQKPLQAGSLCRIEGGEQTKEQIAHVEQKAPTYSHDFDSLSDYAKLFMAYRTLKDDPDIENIKYNQRLLEMISEDVKVVFERVDQIMGPDADPKKFEEMVMQLLNQPDTNQEEKSFYEPKKELPLDPL